MRPSGPTSLFSEGTDRGQQPVSFVFSAVVHGLAIAIAWFAIAYTPRVTHIVNERYSVRELDLHVPDMQKVAKNPLIPYPPTQSAPHPSAPAAPGSAAPSPAAMPQTEQAKLGPQTLVQPDLNKQIQLSQEVPLPQVVIWAPNKVVVKKITPPQPQKPTSAEVKPSIESPNQEINLANVNIASSFHPSPKNIVPPSTTSPVTTHANIPVQMPPTTASQSTLQPTPVQIMSLSDLRAKDATVNLPPVNETKASNAQGPLGVGDSQKTPSTQTSPNAKSEGNGAGQNPNAKTATAGAGAGQGPPSKATTPGAAPGQGTTASAGNSGPGGNGTPGHPGNSSNGSTEEPAIAGATLITVPKDGHFGSVIVGDSLQDQYPEIGEVWHGRLTYTAYLHVGLAKNWILQYSLPRATDASTAGSAAHLDAPWPYSIVRPHLESGSIDADALMVHGFVNQSGRFETLTVLFPEGFPRAQFVLAALQQWQFRPAVRDGQPEKVEVLIIIPETYE